MVRIIIALFFVFRLLPLRKPISNCPREPLSVSKRQSSPGRGTFASGFEVGTEKRKECTAFSNLGLVQRRLGEFDKALESYSFALNFAPLAVPILLDRAAIYMEMGKQTVLIRIIARCWTRTNRTKKLC